MDSAQQGHWEQEEDLEFNFNGLLVERPERGTWPCRMRVVDFVVMQDNGRHLYIEVKEPGRGTDTDENAYFIRKIKQHELINNNLVPKCRDTFLCMWLMKRVDQPIDYVVVLDLSRLPDAKPYLSSLGLELARRLRQEMDEPWARQYARTSIIVSPDDCEDRFGIKCRTVQSDKIEKAD